MGSLEVGFGTSGSQRLGQGIARPVAFHVAIIQSLILAIPAAPACVGSMIILRHYNAYEVFEPIDYSRDMVEQRREWVNGWLAIALYGTLLCLPFFVAAPGVAMGWFWWTSPPGEGQEKV